ncbi:PREDICTED: RNA 3'-terminal phosphate cyclase-like protein [Acropora digitifera]|uniref:RNA 3'-terminal phosphate cyclase-like protein n=1 Tax=Acropora digitifera TaxID=70779 RepID=UPI00077AF2D9|nr:PREDICTED: RNA 3'-terminal phosphate cyclase-like protein [Acropora digitifera]
MAADLSFEGCNFLRQRLVLATLSVKSVRITNIRANEDDPGLKDFEASFIRLMDKLTNGSKIEINETGTMLFYKPGLLSGGPVEHECNPQRSIGYYLEAVTLLAPFCKKPIRLNLKGVTNDRYDPMVDIIKTVTIPVMKRFMVDDEGFDLKILKRGAPPGGGGEVMFSCPVRRNLRPIQFTDPGKIKRIRGLAYAMRVSPAMCNRVVNAARGVLNQFVSDIFIYTDHCKGAQSGRSPGFGISLVAESTTGSILSIQTASSPQGEGVSVIPEDLGKEAAEMLLEEIYRVCTSTHFEWAIFFICLLSNRIQFLRHLKEFFGVMFKIQAQKSEDDDDDDRKTGAESKVLLSCVGVCYTNINKTMV